MRKEARILFVYDPENVPCRTFVDSLHKALAGWDITIASPGFVTRVFEARKYNLVHLFHPPVPRAAAFLKSLPDTIRTVQTILGPPERPDDYRLITGGRRVVVFSRAQKEQLEKALPEVQVECIPPCTALPDVNLLQPSSEVRNHYQVGDRFMVVALSDIASKQDFDNFIYVIREYNRRGEFRFLVPRYRKDKDAQLWRERLQVMIDQEKLTSTTLLQEDVDLHSLIDAADMAVYLRKDPERAFDFSLEVQEAAMLGKPVFCYDVPPYNENFAEFVPAWVCKNTEEFVRESRDLYKAAARLEQTSTEMARFSRGRFSPEKVAAQYKALYEGLQ